MAESQQGKRSKLLELEQDPASLKLWFNMIGRLQSQKERIFTSSAPCTPSKARAGLIDKFKFLILPTIIMILFSQTRADFIVGEQIWSSTLCT
jgi:hypothetical protein